MSGFGGGNASSNPLPDVMSPVPFPNPTVFTCEVKEVMIDGRLRPVMEVRSGNFYEFGRQLRGTIFGQVNHAIKVTYHKESGVYSRVKPLQQYAIKIYFRSKLRELNGRSQENPHQEIAAMQFVGNEHVHVMGQIECCGDNDNIYSVMDFSDGMELFDYVDQNGPLNEETAKRIFHQILLGTQRIHSMDIGHRDMSLENVMVSRSGVARIIDFGMSLRLPRREDGSLLNIRPQGACGKKNYVSPEVIANRAPFNPQLSDIWALGVKLFIMLTGLPVVDMAYDLDERYQMVKAGRLGQMLQHWNINLSAGAIDLMTRILRAVPSERLSLEQILAHPWMASVVSGTQAAPAGAAVSASESTAEPVTVVAAGVGSDAAAEDSAAMSTDA